MTTVGLLTTGAASLLAVLTACTRPAPDPQTAAAARVELGRHLVEQVAMCADCHAPRLPNGQFDRTRWLQGSLLPFAATVPMPWAPVAPSIAGLPGYNDEQAVLFLTTGRRAAGPTRPPMPEFRFADEEARAVVAYLRSLTPASPVAGG
ncbi:MAG: hypothetical protein A3G75_12985 [Verrucomicrobia bacterium RIFCSPLOWO2_12_FULL_64_8]|nr:MAG: hypothetical protein A3G75_12985 [Verrucomicrobia bacterium RIFCSPLOWO2_12_FULL_64_8]